MLMISVIVTEYKRRGYLIHALRSVFNQTLNREKYEVIVVKNEENKEVDEYARKNGAKVIISSEKWLGPKIAQGLEEAKGDIIALLEDDDMFTQDKLENIYAIFKNEKVSEVRNETIHIDSNNNILSTKVDNYKYYINSYNYNHKKYFHLIALNSCISIKRDLINEDIKRLKIVVDIYLSINAICKNNDENILFYGKPLTYYRVHPQNFTSPRTIEEKIYFTENNLLDLQRIYEKFYSCGKEIRKTLKLYLLIPKLGNYLLELYRTNEEKEISNDIKFSFDEKMFLLNPFNKLQKEAVIKGIIASSFLILPSNVRFRLFKFLQKHSNIINKMLEISETV